MSISLIAVFIPMLFMGGLVGRMFREFAATLSIAVAISALVSLTVTPMLAAHLASRAPRPPGWFGRNFEAAMDRLQPGVFSEKIWSLERRLYRPRYDELTPEG